MNPDQTVKVYLYPANNLVPENVVYFLRLLHVFKYTSD